MTDLASERDTLNARLETLKDELAEIDDSRAAIKGQIEQAQTHRQITGEYADADWFRRAKGALRHLGVERNDVAREVGDVSRRLRRLNDLLSRDDFHNAVREVVDEQTYARIVDRARELNGAHTVGALAGRAI
jgi:uncharacterized coiled-coil DUF342 family protein